MWLGTKSIQPKDTSVEDDEAVHRKRVIQILRYISTMQTSGGPGGNGQYSFVRPAPSLTRPVAFFQNQVQDENALGQILFTTFDFQRLTTIWEEQRLKQAATTAPPFSFYASSSSSRKPPSKFGSAFGRSTNQRKASTCWLRLTRWTNEKSTKAPPLVPTDPQVLAYLQKYVPVTPGRVLEPEELARIPASSTIPQSHRLQRWLKRYHIYWANQKMRRALEPLYNHLFEWYQQDPADELDLIWGLGHARMRIAQNNDDDILWIDGPLLEVRVEVELARDGALLVRPKEHVGVSLNRSILAALTTTAASTSDSTARSLHQAVEALDAADLSPGEPSTYIPILKRMAVELSSGGTFQSSKSKNRQEWNSGQLIVTDAWCLYSSPRPGAVWARDASTFADSLSNQATSNSQDQPISIPRALWALTHGPGALDETKDDGDKEAPSSFWAGTMGKLQTVFFPDTGTEDEPKLPSRPPFPLPTSDAQNRIADLLLTKQYPAVVCEGPPGTGKTHTIANIVCAYLCQGKRVLVTSKGAPALSVLRERLPPCVRELCVDVSLSESTGMRQLQQTVERLANKVSWVNTQRELGRSAAFKQDMDDLEGELGTVNDRLSENAEQKRVLVQTQSGQELFELSLELIESAPWMMKTLANWDSERTAQLHSQVESLVVSPGDDIEMVDGYPSPPSDALISLAASKAGLALSYLKNATKEALASVPWLGSQIAEQCQASKDQLEAITINGSKPSRQADWHLVFQALEREKSVHCFRRDILHVLVTREQWPEEPFIEEVGGGKIRIQREIVPVLEKAAKLKKLAENLEVPAHVKETSEVHKQDERRTAIASRIQALAEDLVATRVVAELSRNFTAEAQSALVKFAQVSGKAKFGKSSQASKMSQRQRRRRQEYLDAFEKCVRYIPCWILTTSQISDYLPAECLFDLVVIDEASQSDVTVLPGLLRGKQWLIVGDGKQVSPTESFVSEEQIEMLKAALPESPMEASMLPGHSFFDLCAQAFPKGRIILREHFRCAPEIISYSNTEFYNGNLIPLRLPTSEERLKPSLIDVRLERGQKTGKINEVECDEIVDRIQKYVESCNNPRKRTIGVISLIGDEQSRLIRGRLLERIGPHKYKLHDILVGEPPSFQGAERDIVFLSMVCSPGSVVTQSQLMHAQRINVALSRARDRMVLVRSIDTNHIPNEQDVKFSVLDFFARSIDQDSTKHEADDEDDGDGQGSTPTRPTGLSPFRAKAESLMEELLRQRGFSTQGMGVVWDHAICVEDASSSSRAALCVEATGESQEEWKEVLQQQKSIERVGWSCMRVDALSFLSDHHGGLEAIKKFLFLKGVHPGKVAVQEREEVAEPAQDQDSIDAGQEAEGQGQGGDHNQEQENDIHVAESSMVVISSDEEDFEDYPNDDRKPAAVLDTAPTNDNESLGNGETAGDYGIVADIGFLRGKQGSSESLDPSVKLEHASAGVAEDEMAEKQRTVNDNRKRAFNSTFESSIAPEHDSASVTELDLTEKQRAVSESRKRTFTNDDLSDSAESSDGRAEVVSIAQSRTSKSSKRRRTRLDTYSRDARWYPSRKHSEQDDDMTYEEYLGQVHPEKKDPETETSPVEVESEEDVSVVAVQDDDSAYEE